jgi:glycosyltransferase involved in cell wall biosynthesis
MIEQPRIAIAVHGRFHAFDLSRELIKSGEDVYIYTNYPAAIVRKFGVDPAHARTNVTHGVLSRCAHKLDTVLHKRLEPWVHQSFARWAAAQIARDGCDVVHGFSGVCEEIFQAVGHGSAKTLVRGSAHIETQAELLEQEEQRAGVTLDKPSPWMRAREAREYAAADLIFVLSNFARQSFLDHGIEAAKIRLLPLGSELRRFAASPEAVLARRRRIVGPAKLRVLTVGTFSFRKGAIDYLAVAKACQEFAEFRFVGAVSREAARLREQAQSVIEFLPKVPQFDLPAQYQWADVFLFPTIEDGYAVVLAQAQAAGLPILTTANCAGPELISNAETGWVLPIRNAEAFVEKLRQCHTDRERLAQMADSSAAAHNVRDWSAVGADFSRMQRELLIQHGTSR